MGFLFLVTNIKGYPWLAAYPQTVWVYLILQFTLSIIFVFREQVLDLSFPVEWFAIFHIILLAFFVVLLILLRGGKQIIEHRDADIKAKVANLGFMMTSVESLIQKYPEKEQPLRQVAEALRYSDPMSDPALAVYEDQIQQRIYGMHNGADIDSSCYDLLRQIADRNSRVKLLK